ncbi:sulfatase [Halorussus sp. AFM4]|uniref:sulfatase n=1 Tax=Halorussus sp. AFM4 TaxID=3421651 RepID=UPI003EB804AF
MPETPNVVLLVLDTLRADAISCYDGGAEFDVRTPNLDRVAARGTVFERAFSTGAWTPTAHGSLFSGRYPAATGFLGEWPTMPDSVPLLAERFERAGYDTIGVQGPAKMGPGTGLDRGFEAYYDVYSEVADRPSLEYAKQMGTNDRVRRDFLRLVTRGNDYYTGIRFDALEDAIDATGRPFFAAANVPTAHWPYDPPRPYKREATPALSRPRIPLVEEFRDAQSFDDPAVRDDRLFAAADGRDGRSVDLLYYDDPAYLNDAELDVLRRWYGACVRYLDEWVGRFLDFLEARGLTDDTLLVVTSDHGEFFGEHDVLYHGNFLHDAVTHVPLLFAGPGVEPGVRRDDLASLVDLFDTFCDLCGLSPPDGTDGRSLFGSGERDAVFAEEAVFDLSDEPDAGAVSDETLREFELGRKSIRTDEYRFELRSDGSERLYELPDERVITDPGAEVVDSLRDRLVDALGEEFRSGAGETAEYGEAVERNLRQLGYIE